MVAGVLILIALQYVVLGYQALSVVLELSVLAMLVLIPGLLLMRARRMTAEVLVVIGAFGVFAVGLGLSTMAYGNPRADGLRWFLTDLFLDAKPYIMAVFILLTVANGQYRRLVDLICVALVGFAVMNLPFVLRDALFAATSIHGVPLETRGAYTIPLGVFDHKLKSATTMLLGTVGALTLAIGTPSRASKYGVIAAALFISVFLHLSVKEMVSAILVLLCFVLIRRGVGNIRRLLVMLVLPIAVLMLSSFDNPLRAGLGDRISVFLGEGGADTVRTRSYIGSVHIAQAHFPLGSGAATFMSRGARDVYSPYFHATGISGLYGGTESDRRFLMDTFWPKILAQSGAIGGMAYGAMVLFLVALALRQLITDPRREAFFAGSILLTIFVSSLATPIFTRDSVIPVLAVAIAFLVSRTAKDARRAGRLKKGRITHGAPPQARGRTGEPNGSDCILPLPGPGAWISVGHAVVLSEKRCGSFLSISSTSRSAGPRFSSMKLPASCSATGMPSTCWQPAIPAASCPMGHWPGKTSR